jgi:uncharacterized RDD family membrane protein YckC
MTDSTAGFGVDSAARATFVERFVAFLVDSVLLGFVNYVLVQLLGDASQLASLVVGIAYFGTLEGGPTGQTVGKKVMRIKVVRASTGDQLGFGTALLRWVAHFLSAIVFLLGYFWMLWDPERQCWHDKIARTLVIPAPRT